MREHLAWLMWCYEQGYRTPEDRDILSNWIAEDRVLCEEDAETKRQLLQMADEILEQMDKVE